MPWAIILVGALNVGSMATVWHGDVTPRKHREVTALPVTDVLAPTALPKGAEMARFNMGSTIILLLPPGAADWARTLTAGRTLRMGERIGTLRGLDMRRSTVADRIVAPDRQRSRRCGGARRRCAPRASSSARATCSKWKRRPW